MTRARASEKQVIVQMITLTIIESLKTERAPLIMFVPKKIDIVGFCVDYKKLNVMMIRDYYHIPRMDGFIDAIGQATRIKQGIWASGNGRTWFVSYKAHVSSQFSAFPEWLLELKKPETWQEAMDVLAAKVIWQFAFIPLDDVVTFLRTPDEKIDHA